MKYETIYESHSGKYWGEYYDSHEKIITMDCGLIVKVQKLINISFNYKN